MALSVQQVMEYVNKLRSEKDNFWEVYQEAFFWTRPQENVFNDKTAGERKGVEVFDSTAEDATETFAHRYQNALMPQEQEWCKFVLGKGFKKQIKQVNGDEIGQALIDEIEVKLQDQTDIFNEYFNKSNLHLEFRKSFRDLAIGTFCAIINEEEDQEMPFSASSVPLHTLSVGEGPMGTITDTSRDIEVKGNNVLSRWPRATLSSSLSKIITAEPQKKITFIECCIFNRKDKVYEYYIIWDTEAGKEFVFQTTFLTNPFIVNRYLTTAEEALGRGPAIIKLADIKSLNKMREFRLKGLARAAGGIFLAEDDGIFNPFLDNFEPDSVIAVERTDSIKEMEYRGNPQAMEYEIQPLVAGIKEAYFSTDIHPQDDPVRSATEVVIRNQKDLEKQRGGYSRAKVELLDGVVTRIVDILVRRNIMDEITVNKNVISFQYAGPLAMAQDRADLTVIGEAISMSNQLVGPERTAQAYNLDRIARAPADKLGIDKNMLNTAEEKQAAMQQQQAAAEQLAQQGG